MMQAEILVLVTFTTSPPATSPSRAPEDDFVER